MAAGRLGSSGSSSAAAGPRRRHGRGLGGGPRASAVASGSGPRRGPASSRSAGSGKGQRRSVDPAGSGKKRTVQAGRAVRGRSADPARDGHRARAQPGRRRTDSVAVRPTAAGRSTLCVLPCAGPRTAGRRCSSSPVGLALVGLCAFVVVTVIGVAGLLWRSRAERGGPLGRRPAARESEHPRLHNLVDGLCATMGLAGRDLRGRQSRAERHGRRARPELGSWSSSPPASTESLTLVRARRGPRPRARARQAPRHGARRPWPCVALPWAVVRGTAAGAETVHRLVGRGREFAADQRAAAIVRYPPGHRLGARVDDRPTPATAAAWPPGSGRIAAPHPLALDRPDGRIGAARADRRGTSTTPGSAPRRSRCC